MSTVTTSPVIRFVLIPELPEQKAIRALVVEEAVAEVRRALNAWAYSVEPETMGNVSEEA